MSNPYYKKLIKFKSLLKKYIEAGINSENAQNLYFESRKYNLKNISINALSYCLGERDRLWNNRNRMRDKMKRISNKINKTIYGLKFEFGISHFSGHQSGIYESENKENRELMIEWINNHPNN